MSFFINLKTLYQPFCNQLVYNKQISMAVLHKQSVSIINADKQALTLSVFSVHGIRTSQDEIRAKCSQQRRLISDISSCFRLFDIGLF